MEKSNTKRVEPGSVKLWQLWHMELWQLWKNIKSCGITLTGSRGVCGMPGEIYVNAEKGKKGKLGEHGPSGFSGPQGEKQNFLSSSMCRT